MGHVYDFEYSFYDFWGKTSDNLTVYTERKNSSVFLKVEDDCRKIVVPDNLGFRY